VQSICQENVDNPSVLSHLDSSLETKSSDFLRISCKQIQEFGFGVVLVYVFFPRPPSSCTVFPSVFLPRPVKFLQSSPKTCRLLSSSSVWSWTKFLVYEQIVVVILSFILLFQGLECTINFTQAPTAKAEIKFQGSHLSLFIRPIAVLVRDFFTWRR